MDFGICYNWTASAYEVSNLLLESNYLKHHTPILQTIIVVWCSLHTYIKTLNLMIIMSFSCQQSSTFRLITWNKWMLPWMKKKFHLYTQFWKSNLKLHDLCASILCRHSNARKVRLFFVDIEIQALWEILCISNRYLCIPVHSICAFRIENETEICIKSICNRNNHDNLKQVLLSTYNPLKMP